MKNKKLCKCKRYWHPDKYKMCWECWSKQPVNTLKKFKIKKTEAQRIFT